MTKVGWDMLKQEKGEKRVIDAEKEVAEMGREAGEHNIPEIQGGEN